MRRQIALRLYPRLRHLPVEQLASVDLAGTELLSLDVFDTCITRAVLDPPDLFELVPGRAGADLADIVTGGEPSTWFRVERISAEARARHRHPIGEPNLDQIYAELNVPDGDDRLERLKHAEVELERWAARGRPEVAAFATRAADHGVRVVYMSDMYLSSLVIAELLADAGLPRGDVLVSNETAASKASGRAFAALYRRYDVAPDRVLHLGDNARADGVAAVRAGSRALVVDRVALDLRRPFETYHVPASCPIGDSIALGTAVATAGAVEPPTPTATATRIGATAVAPLQLAFATWLTQVSDDDETLLFCSRDMQTTLRTFQRLRDLDGRASRAEYFQVSRRSVGLPALAGGIEPDDHEFLVGGRGRITEHELWARLGLAHLAGPDAGHPLALHERQPVLDRMLAHSDDIVAEAINELRGFAQYWHANALPTAGRVTLVDIGWRATVQHALRRTLHHVGISVDLAGRYLALLDPPRRGSGPAHGWLVDNGAPTSTRIALEAGIPILELAFQADEGSTVGYTAGRPTTGPRSNNRAIQDALQRGAAETLDAWFALRTDTRPTAVSVQPMLRLLNSPRPREAVALGAMQHSDRLGTAHELRGVLPPTVHLKDLVGSRSSAALVRSNEWRPGLVAAAGLWLPVRRLTTTALGSLKWIGRLAARLRGRR